MGSGARSILHTQMYFWSSLHSNRQVNERTDEWKYVCVRRLRRLRREQQGLILFFPCGTLRYKLSRSVLSANPKGVFDGFLSEWVYILPTMV